MREHEPAGPRQEHALVRLTAQRERLFAIAYRMLGSVEDAEDLVQETFIRWARVDPNTIESPAAWLTTVVTRLALNQLQSARKTREAYIGPWLPEPMLTLDEPSPSDRAELADSLSIAFLAVLERLTPRERAVFLLRDVLRTSMKRSHGCSSYRRQTAARCFIGRANVSPPRPRGFTPIDEHTPNSSRVSSAL
jgi:RNA polymerase sigma-70 factor, ECF subfamily